MNDEDARRLAALLDLGILDTPPEPVFDDVVLLARQFCATPVALVSLVATERQWFKARVGFDLLETPIGQSVCTFALSEPEALVITDLSLDPRTKDNSLVSGPPFIRFYAGVPLRTPGGIAVGSLCVIDTEPRPQGLEPAQIEALRSLGRQTMALMLLRRASQDRDEALTRMREAGLATLEKARAGQETIARLRATEMRLRGAQEAGRVGAFEADLLSGRCFVTPELCRVFGLPDVEELNIRDIEALIVPEDRALASTSMDWSNGTAMQDSEYRVRRADDGVIRWIARRGALDRDRDGRKVRWLGVVQDITERKAIEARRSALVGLGDALRDAETISDVVAAAARIIGRTLDASRAGYAAVDLAGETISVESDWTEAGTGPIAGKFPIQTFARTIEALKGGESVVVADVPACDWLGPDRAGYELIATRAFIKVPLVRRRELVGLIFVQNAVPRVWSAAEVAFAAAVADRTYAAIAKAQAETHQKILNQELSHRLKNTLALVQAIASQTLRGIEDKPAVRAFEARLIALSNAHDMLLQESWSAASIHSVVDGILKLQGCVQKVDVCGPDLKMGPKATLSTSLLLHELVTNAIKYGALSTDGGRVDLRWSTELAGAHPALVMTWVERGGPTLPPTRRQGFGSRLIAMGIAGASSSEMDFRPTGLVARFRAPMSAIVEA